MMTIPRSKTAVAVFTLKNKQKSSLEFIFNSVIFSDSLTAGAASQQAARASFIMQGHSVDFYSVFIV